MERMTTLLLRLVIYIVGLIVLGLCIFWLPYQANFFAETAPEFAHLKYPLLFGIYATAIPFFVALFQGLKLLRYIDKKQAFTDLSVVSLRNISYSAVAIGILYLVGIIFLVSQNAGHPGIVLISLVIIFAMIVIAVFAAVLQKLLKNVIDIKSENDMTV